MLDLSLLRPEVARLIVACDVKLITFDEMCIKYPFFKQAFTKAKAFGCYEPHSDLIGVDETYKGSDINLTVLHELTHWTGHIKRLGRRTLYERNFFTHAIEEVTAAYGMRMLANHLNFKVADVDKEFRRQLMRYKVYCPVEKMIPLAQDATDYIIKLSESQLQLKAA